jgi:hypothetical protein
MLDETSRKIFLQSVSKIATNDPCNRIYIWRTLVDHVQMGLIKPEAFMRCVVENLPGENTEFALQMILEKTFTQILAPYFTFERAVADSMFETVLGKLCQTEDRSR